MILNHTELFDLAKGRNLWKNSYVLFLPVHSVIKMLGDLAPNFAILTRALRAVTEVLLLVMQKANGIMADSLGRV